VGEQIFEKGIDRFRRSRATFLRVRILDADPPQLGGTRSRTGEASNGMSPAERLTDVVYRLPLPPE